MDIFSLASSVALFLVPFIVYILLSQDDKHYKYRKPVWYSSMKRLMSINVIRRYMKSSKTDDYENKWERPIKLTDESEEDVHLIFGTDQEGNSIYIKFATRLNKYAEVSIQLRLHTGQIYQLPNEPQVLTCSLSKREWKARGLSIECVEPCKIYRVTYNGFVKNNTSVEQLRFNLIWTAASEPIYYPSDYDKCLFSEALAREPWRDGDWLKLLGDRIGYDQYGCLYGEIYGSMLQYKMRTVNIPTCRKRYNGTADRFTLHRDLGIFISTEDGTLINIGTRSIKNGCSHLRYGTVLHNNGAIVSINSSDISLEEIGEYGKLPEAFALHITTRRSSMKCIFHVQFEYQSDTYSNEVKGWKLTNVMAECDVNQQQGRAFITSWHSRKGSSMELPLPLLKEVKMPEEFEKLVVLFEDEESKCPEIAGRKATPIASLASINSETFFVPEGIIVTAQAMQKQIERSEGLRQAVINVILNFNDDEKLKQLCDMAVSLFQGESISEEISKSILLEIGRIRSKVTVHLGNEKLKWIIRASEVNEEFTRTCNDLQYIECSSIAEILKSMMLSWGSCYSYERVKYRLAHGLPIRCNVALLIQRKIEADITGTIFPYDPVNTDISKICINIADDNKHYNAVLRRNYKNELSIEHAGDPKFAEENLIDLGKLSMFLEEKFGSPRCLEFGLHEGKVYVFRVKEAELLTEWTDKELEHELDDPILSEKEIYTKENVKEVMPDAITALSGTVVRCLVSDSWERIVLGRANKCVNLAFVSIYHHTFINALNMTWKIAPEKIGIWTWTSDLTMFGYPVTTELVRQRAIDKNGRQSMFTKLSTLSDIGSFLWATEKSFVRICKLSKEDICINHEMTLTQTYRAIQDFTKIVDCIARTHYVTWKANAFYHLATLKILLGDEQEYTSDHYHDMALIFSSCKNVITADIPNTLEKISLNIRKTNRAEEFALLDPEDCIEWLEDNVPDGYKLFKTFMVEHGYRSFKEYELMEDSWTMNPLLIVSMIQKICTIEPLTKKRKILSVGETISKLRTVKGQPARFFLKVLITQCRKKISLCELTKSELAKAINKLRVGYNVLAGKLVENGNIPDASLIFHLTKYEVGRICEERVPSLVMKASRRKSLFEEWNEYKFPDWLFLSYPTDLHQVPTKAKGIPINSTEVTGRCCCISSLDELDLLQSGDILITHSIDIRWYPYFPILAGIVTESGGLLSHGIVAAREYGLPCLTGVKDVMKSFTTGTVVTLSGKNGTIQVIQKE